MNRGPRIDSAVDDLLCFLTEDESEPLRGQGMRTSNRLLPVVALGKGASSIAWPASQPTQQFVSILCLFGGGCTSYPDKLDALLHTLALETAYSDRQECIARYAGQVLSIVTDQGCSAQKSIQM